MTPVTPYNTKFLLINLFVLSKIDWLLMEDYLWWKIAWWKMTFDWGWPLIKTTFENRQPLLETNFDGGWPLMEDGSKISLDGIWHLMEDGNWWRRTFDEDNLWKNTTFIRRRHLMEDDHWWKTIPDGRRPLMKDGLW